MAPPTDLEEVLRDEIKPTPTPICREWHFRTIGSRPMESLIHVLLSLDIYFHQKNADSHHAALELRDAVLRLRRDGAFVAVPLFRVNTEPMGPHPIGSYEIWVPSETFASVFSYLCQHRGDLSDHEFRNAWIGPSLPLDLSTLPLRSDEIPLQYPILKLGYSSKSPQFSLEERRKLGANIERLLKHEKEAAGAPPRLA
ncbi:hypothetical protein C0995_013345 [Termitomyces sp. Mi166|nr:hypothetical protein C0995_013345 [Termitomyces sp. Mi166\